MPTVGQVWPSSPSAVDANAFRPVDHGMIAWAFDPSLASTTGALVAGSMYMIKLRLAAPATITNVIMFIATVGSGLSSNQNFAGLFDTSGNRLALTADQTGNWATSGSQIMPLTAPYAAVGGNYYVALLCNGSTPISPARSSGNVSGTIGTGPQVRYGRTTATFTGIPTSVGIGSLNGTNSVWAAVS